MSWTGGCQCGAVRYRLAVEPMGSNVCHCRMCQKAGGGPFMAFAGVKFAELEWTRGAPKVFASSDFAQRGFCPDCGTPLTYRATEHDRIAVTIGSLDHAGEARPEKQFGSASKLSWTDAISALPARDFTATLNGRSIHSHQHPDHET
jgi:hypothetical protein